MAVPGEDLLDGGVAAGITGRPVGGGRHRSRLIRRGRRDELAPDAPSQRIGALTAKGNTQAHRS
jgi:hypothetical protein